MESEDIFKRTSLLGGVSYNDTFSYDLAKRILLNLSLSELKNLALVSKFDRKITTDYMRDVLTFFYKRDIKDTPINKIILDYACLEYYKNLNEELKSKTIKDFFNIIIFHIKKYHGEQAKEIEFVLHDTVLQLNCTNRLLLKLVSKFLKINHNLELQFLDSEKNVANLYREEVEKKHIVRLFTASLFDYLSLSDLENIAFIFINQLLKNEINFVLGFFESKYKNQRMSVNVTNEKNVVLQEIKFTNYNETLLTQSFHNYHAIISVINNKLGFQLKEPKIPQRLEASEYCYSIIFSIDQLKQHPGFMKLAQEACVENIIKPILNENIEPTKLQNFLDKRKLNLQVQEKKKETDCNIM